MIDKEKRANDIERSAAENLSFHARVSADVIIGSLPFRLSYQYGAKDSIIRLEWNNPQENTLPFRELNRAFADSPLEFTIPDAIEGFELQITKVALSYFFKRKGFAFLIEAVHYGRLRIETEQKDRGTFLNFSLELCGKFHFNELPVLDSVTNPSDYIGLQQFALQIDPLHNVQAGAILQLAVAGNEMVIPIGVIPESLTENVAITAALAENTALTDSTAPAGNMVLTGDPSQVKWMDIRKDLGPLHLSRIGFTMGDGCAVLHVDAGVRLSILLLEFIDLYLSIPFQSGKSIDYGLKGIAVTMTRPPLTISGGLYLSGKRTERIYTGEVTIRFQKLGLTALCSYGEFDDGKPSLFAFLMLDAVLGGPPVFYVTAAAGGFGYNRAIRIPERVQDVERFPFVAATMNKGNLKPSMTPAEVLTAMQDDITLQNNQYFISAGIRFTSFGIVESFALLNVEFGTYFRISLLGLSRLSFPLGSKSPLAYLELGLKMVIAPDDGIFSIEGALSSASYLLDRNCKLQGGFAFIFWFGRHEHAGDFVITLGGYRKGFQVAHYPQIDRIGVNWKMDEHLNLSAEFYFAVVPSCIMMGGQLNLTYENGRLQAWLRVWAEFFMQWKPFLYDFSIGVSLGASYRWDFFPFYKTFKVELGADLELWGPPFGGKAHISWWIISFTIRFGSGRPTAEAVGWNDFTDTFLHTSQNAHKSLNMQDSQYAREKANAQNETGEKLIKIQASQGIIKEQNGMMLMDADHLQLDVTSQMMCTSVRFGQKEIAKCATLGILPMKVSSFTSILTAELIKVTNLSRAVSSDTESPLCAKALCQNVPKALWASTAPAPDDTEMLLKDIPCGLTILCQPKNAEGVLPAQGAYDMDILCRNERLTPHICHYTTPVTIPPVKYPQSEWQELIEKSIGKTGGTRKDILDDAARICGVWTENEISVSGWTASLDQMLYAQPVIGTIGAIEDAGQIQTANIHEPRTAQMAVRAPRLFFR